MNFKAILLSGAVVPACISPIQSRTAKDHVRYCGQARPRAKQ
ncbi:MAG TPA: hypothetical protein VJM78_09700 [Rhizomicrobium sp.]|nr:hypothetical protein [Rhizomicrobium sp.]